MAGSESALKWKVEAECVIFQTAYRLINLCYLVAGQEHSRQVLMVLLEVDKESRQEVNLMKHPGEFSL